MIANIALLLIGAFYAVAGVIVARAGLTLLVIDAAAGALSLEKPNAAEIARNRINLVVVVLMFSGGVMLMGRIEFALVAFVACALLQAIYFFVLAPFWLDPADPPRREGRRQSLNAFVIYLAASLFVAWAWSTGRLYPLSDASRLLIAGIALAIAGFVGHIIVALRSGKPTV